MVHITNGDAVAEKLRRWAGEPRLIVWRDILHEGPVPAGLPLEELSALRHTWLTENGLGLDIDFAERDRQLRRLVTRDSLWLWFEDDLYDQLQLLHLLDFLHRERLTLSPHFLIDIPRDLAVEQMAGLAAAKARVTPAMFETAQRAWAAFTSPDRHALSRLLETDLSALPHLRPSIERLLEHYPENNRVERTIVLLLADGGLSSVQLFERYQQTEDRPFLGATVFDWYLSGLAPHIAQDERGIYRLHPGIPAAPRERWLGGCVSRHSV